MNIPLGLLPPNGGSWDRGDRLGASIRTLRLPFTPTLALPCQGRGSQWGRIFARNHLSSRVYNQKTVVSALVRSGNISPCRPPSIPLSLNG